MEYGKCLKISMPFGPNQLFLKILSEMANRVDPDQTAPSGAV